MAAACEESSFDCDKALKELQEQGYTVVPNVISHAQCDKFTAEYKAWLKQFDDQGIALKDKHSLVQSYRVGHFQSSWEARLSIKYIFAKLWNTEKLLTSADAIAISKPPEESGEFTKPGENFLHLDQSVKRTGLHAYQSGLYLEETTTEDHCFRVLSHSHKYHSEFFQCFPAAVQTSRRKDFFRLNPEQIQWYESQGCARTKIAVPKGGMILWDSRTIHDNCRPEQGRKHTDRWRVVIFISMTPARWANGEDLKKKKEAYEQFLMTSHWSSQGIRHFQRYTPDRRDIVKTVTHLPEAAKTYEAQQLFGVVPYKYNDGKPNGPPQPEWATFP